ncbi:ATP-binding protein [Psychromonas sp. PT13]|uniref:ATP-binding protein n=1 Tax=Psychromonas sp. PT13 TaxID=3439547 RepID=UPI003EBC8649
MLRNLININNDLCDGCGGCLEKCTEGGLQLINGKAHLVNDLICIGFGNCVTNCPTNAIQMVQRKEIPSHHQLIMIKSDSLILV